MKLSLCIPTYNEEKSLHYSLDSGYDLADEVIIVDGTSTDKTVEIARARGKKIKVFIVVNPANFLQNKQTAIEKAGGDWILQLDADEALTPELAAEIKDVLKNKEAKEGYFIPRKNFFLGRFLMKGGVYPDYVLRLYKRDKGSFTLNDIHENVKIDGRIGYLKHPLLHYADPDFSRYLLRWDRYTSFDAKEAVRTGTKLSLVDYFFLKPTGWFFKTYFRHKGFMDGFPGFVFSLFSAIRFWVIYIKFYQLKSNKSTY